MRFNMKNDQISDKTCSYFNFTYDTDKSTTLLLKEGGDRIIHPKLSYLNYLDTLIILGKLKAFNFQELSSLRIKKG